MTGGVPYGRPMASLAPDRDGLRLDRLPVTLGPWFPVSSGGAAASGRASPATCCPASRSIAAASHAPSPADDPFVRVLREPVSIRDLELARVAQSSAGAGSGRRTWRRTRGACPVGSGDGQQRRPVDPSQRRCAGAQAPLVWIPAVDHQRASGDSEPMTSERAGLGPIGRAAGIADDARADSRRTGTSASGRSRIDSGDARARWRVRMAEMRQSLELAACVRRAHGRVRSRPSRDRAAG